MYIYVYTYIVYTVHTYMYVSELFYLSEFFEYDFYNCNKFNVFEIYLSRTHVCYFYLKK